MPNLKLTDDEIRGRLNDEIRAAVGYNSAELSNQRKTALEYYYGEPFGNESEGRSSYVSRDVADTIEWIMPSLMRIFTGGDSIVKFEPQGPEDEGNARQATDYVNYIFQRQNDGFLTLYTWFKDALLSKNGFVKVYWEEYTETETENYENLSDDEFALILQESEPEVVEHTETQGKEGNLHAAKIRTTTKGGKCCVIPVPPEEVLVSKNPVSPLHKNRFRAHRRRVTISELKEMGFTDVDDLSDQDSEFNQETIARFSNDQTDSVGDDTKDKATREVWLAECFINLDVDGDGIAEERTITMAGNKILQNEEGTTAQLVTITPIILPHKLYGMSIADLVMDLQLLKSTVFRQILDNMYLANNGRYMALDGMVNIDDLLTSRPGGIVRVKTFDAVKPMQPPLLGAPAFNLLEYIDTIKENRTGVTRYNQGVDADSLNKTATGVNQIMNASQQRVELIARVFAETGVKDLFYAILESVQKHQKKEQVIRLRNEWVPMDPQEWKNKFDLTVTVGLGTGSRESQINALNTTLQYQVTALQMGLPIVTPENVYNAAVKQLEAQNIKGADLFYTHPSKMPPQQPQPNPDQIKLQIEQMKGEHKAGMQQMKGQQDMMKQEQKAAHEKSKQELQGYIDSILQQQQQAAEVHKQREASAAQAHENDKASEKESNLKLVDMIWEKRNAEGQNDAEQNKAKLDAMLQIIQDNNKHQNDTLLKVLEAAMAERENEVTERDAKGKAKKVTSRVKKKSG